ncbi:hypothetical protein CMEL01_03707 [Colletotrichum melonis]|uniref:Uncharacterized protein n=1 Tax=Colletotrichum melonis TaxID=1209925 RepID=A0AAI9UAU6_9PEZI|nr:hypothetical protein CMEL01_03707 [Colletotrichum melonis]
MMITTTRLLFSSLDATYKVKLRQPKSATWSALLLETVAGGTCCIHDHQSEMGLTIPARPTPSRDDRHDEWTGLPLGAAYLLLTLQVGRCKRALKLRRDNTAAFMCLAPDLQSDAKHPFDVMPFAPTPVAE